MLTAGANNVAICWGPALGAKAVKYRSAVLLGCISQLAGVLAFGPRTYTVYGGFLSSVFTLDAQPRLTLYAIMWTVITPVVWQFLAIRWRVLVPVYLGTGKISICADFGCTDCSIHRSKQEIRCLMCSCSCQHSRSCFGLSWGIFDRVWTVSKSTTLFVRCWACGPIVGLGSSPECGACNYIFPVYEKFYLSRRGCFSQSAVGKSLCILCPVLIWHWYDYLLQCQAQICLLFSRACVRFEGLYKDATAASMPMLYA